MHLNFPLREPLVLDEPLPREPDDGAARRPASRRTAPAPPAIDLDARRARAVIVAGRHERDDGLGEALAAAAAALGTPLLADPLSGARRGPAAVAHYDALLRDAGFAAAHRPRGRASASATCRPPSRCASGWRASTAPPGRLRSRGRLAGPGRRRDARSLDADPRRAGRARSPAPPRASRLARRAGAAADAAAAEAIAAALGRRDLSEPRRRARARRALPGEVTVFTASSMPVRDVESFWPARDAPPRVLAHRGANGIDGTLAAAFGAAAAGAAASSSTSATSPSPTTSARLLSATRLKLALTIVLVDNAGGGIFDFLPVASQTDAFEEHVATPTGLDAERVAALFGLAYERVDDLGRTSARPPAALAARPHRPRRRTSRCTVALHEAVAVRLAS